MKKLNTHQLYVSMYHNLFNHVEEENNAQRLMTFTPDRREWIKSIVKSSKSDGD